MNTFEIGSIVHLSYSNLSMAGLEIMVTDGPQDEELFSGVVIKPDGWGTYKVGQHITSFPKKVYRVK